MKNNLTSPKFRIVACLLLVVFASCSKDCPCTDRQIQPAFIGFNATDIDTFIVRKFRPNDNFQHLIDTGIISIGNYGLYETSHDTTSVFITKPGSLIVAGYDWQLYVPANHKTITISDISSEKKVEKCGGGIFSMDPGSGCFNSIFSVKQDNQLVNFTNNNFERYYSYIHP